MELTAKSSFCQKGSRRDFFIESGRCVFEQVDNNCTIQMARALQAATKAPVGEARRKLICWYVTFRISCDRYLISYTDFYLWVIPWAVCKQNQAFYSVRWLTNDHFYSVWPSPILITPQNWAFRRSTVTFKRSFPNNCRRKFGFNSV